MCVGNTFSLSLFDFKCRNYFLSYHILIPQGATGSSTFLVSDESPYFSYNPKFQTQIHYSLEVTAENVPISQCHILVLAPGEKLKSKLEV